MAALLFSCMSNLCLSSSRDLSEEGVSRLEESGIVTRCEITTYEPEQMLDITFDDSTRVQKLIMKSEWLKDALTEVEANCDKLVFSFSPSSTVAAKKVRQDKKGKGKAARQEEEDWGEESALHDPRTHDGPSFRLEAHGPSGSSEVLQHHQVLSVAD